MTYRKLYESAIRKLEKSEITLGEYEEMTKPLNEDVRTWIPVSERLPENNEDVLVYDNSDIFVAWYRGMDFDWCSADNRFDEYTPIIAWMPLPKPYKAESEE